MRINRKEIISQLKDEISESFTAFTEKSLTDTNYSNKVLINLYEKIGEKKGKFIYGYKEYELAIIKSGKLEFNEDVLNKVLEKTSTKKTEFTGSRKDSERYKEHIISMINVEYKAWRWDERGRAQQTTERISGEEWKQLRKSQKIGEEKEKAEAASRGEELSEHKLKEKIRPISAVSGTTKHKAEQLERTEAERDAQKWRQFKINAISSLSHVRRLKAFKEQQPLINLLKRLITNIDAKVLYDAFKGKELGEVIAEVYASDEYLIGQGLEAFANKILELANSSDIERAFKRNESLTKYIQQDESGQYSTTTEFSEYISKRFDDEISGGSGKEYSIHRRHIQK